MAITIPITFAPNTPATAADQNTNWDAVRAYLNGSLAVAELAPGSAGQMIVCNASGVPTYRGITGDVAVSNAGVASVVNDAVSFAKMQNIGTDRLVGRDTAGSGDPEEIALGAGLAFSGSGAIELPGLGTYRTLATALQSLGSASSGTDYLLRAGGTAAATGFSAQDRVAVSVLPLAASDHAVAGKTTKLRVKALVATGQNAGSGTVNVGLHPVSGINNGEFTVGAALAGSAVSVSKASANAVSSGAGSDFDFPADGHYGLGFRVSAGVNNAINVFAWLQLRYA